MDVYLDTSALAKRYLQEPGSPRVRAIVAYQSTHVFTTSALTCVEVAATVARLHRGGRLTLPETSLALADAHADAMLLSATISPSRAILDNARRLAVLHGLRGYDAVHLATALTVDTRSRAAADTGAVLVTSDRELLAAAQAEGLLVEDPTDPTTFVL